MASSPLLLPLLLFSLLPLSLSQSADQQTLLQIKHDLGDPAALSTWTSTTSLPHCNWTGVTCSSNGSGSGSVTELSLSSINITSALPSSICRLKSLRYLDLSYNGIPGSFPSFLSNCTNLEYLDLSNNELAGELPADVDAVLPKVTYFCLSENNFTGEIPASIGKMTQLQSLWLDNNNFTGTMPGFVSNLTSLEQLALAWNAFSPGTIPAEYGNLTKLTFLFVAKANLGGEIPDSLTRLTRMVQFDLSMNSLHGSIPPGIWSFASLKYLYLYDNNLTGEITVNEPFGANGLEQIDLTKNQLTGPIPESFGTLQNLSVLFLSYNQFSGEIPTGIGLLPRLTDVRLFYNNLSGFLPPELGKHSPLWNLEVFNNLLSGEIPRNICYNGSFTSLDVSNNNMNGSIPESLGNCPHLDNIQVDNNRFTGEVPAGIWKMQNLTTVVMTNNQLSGELPSALPANLTRLDITNNRFSGSVPSYSRLIKVFKASGNNFTGNISSSLFTGMPLLETLDLSQNSISGKIPASIGSLDSLNLLNLSHNKISGEIPASIGSMPVLTSLDLSSNKLSGDIPTALGGIKFNFLNLSSNNLSGEIPLGIDSAAYDESFLSNPGLCSSVSINGVGRCRGQSSNGISHGLRYLFVALGVIILAIVLIFAQCLIRDYRRRKDASDPAMWKLTSFHRLDFTENSIVRGMNKENLVGTGGSGQVYRVAISPRAGDVVAVKRIYNKGKVGAKLEHEFDSEVKILGSIRHANIVKLLCCISSPDSKLLVYEYMENSSLDKWLHGKRNDLTDFAEAPTGSLDWPTRIQIAIGAARGLSYMHHEYDSPIVHRDVKSSNILLDSEFNAKIADFGLARMLMKPDAPETVSAVAGSFGYMAPECGYSRKVTEKVDVYSFGVVLLELTTGREAHDGGNHSSLAEWAWWNIEEGNNIYNCLEKVIRETPYLNEIEVIFKLGVICTNKNPSSRPAMRDVLDVLVKYDVLSHNTSPNPNKKLSEYDADPLLETKKNSDNYNGLVCNV